MKMEKEVGGIGVSLLIYIVFSIIYNIIILYYILYNIIHHIIYHIGEVSVEMAPNIFECREIASS